MDPRTRQFLVYLLFSLACVGLGMLARSRKWVGEDKSPGIHLASVLWFWSPVVLLSFWRLPVDGSLLRFMLTEPLLMIAAALAVAGWSHWRKWPRDRRGLLILAAVLSNKGFTLGAYLCAALLRPQQEALDLGMALVMSMQGFMVLFFYPVAAHDSPQATGSRVELIRSSLLTLRAAPLYAAAAGLLLNAIDLPGHETLGRPWLMELFFYLGGGSAYFGIGLRLRPADVRYNKRLQLGVAVLHFLLLPLAAWGLGAGLTAAGWPPAELYFNVLLIEAFSPIAINLVILANLFGLDARLAAALWLSNTVLFCLIPLPVLLWLYA